MLELIADLFEYQAWADSQIVAAVQAHAPAAQDDRIRALLHHIVAVQRYFIAKSSGQNAPGDLPPVTFDELAALFTAAHAEARDFLASLSPEALPAVRTWLVQTVLHSQHHRGQVSTRLRALGGNPPTVDFIIWTRKRA